MTKINNFFSYRNILKIKFSNIKFQSDSPTKKKHNLLQNCNFLYLYSEWTGAARWSRISTIASVKTFEFYNLNHHVNHCGKTVRLRSFAGLFFPPLGLNTDIYSLNLHIQFKCGTIWTTKAPNTDNCYTVNI